MICGPGYGCRCGIESSSLIVGFDGSTFTLETNAFIICTSSTRPTPSAVGQHIYETDTRRQLVWDGTFWVITAGAFPTVNVTKRTSDTPQPIPSGEGTPVTLLSEVDDTDGFHAGTSDTFTVPAGLGGDYDIKGGVQWASSASGYRTAFLSFSGNAGPVAAGEMSFFRQGGHPMISTVNNGNAISKDVKMAAGASVSLRAIHNTGSDLNCVQAFMTMRMTRHIPSL